MNHREFEAQSGSIAHQTSSTISNSFSNSLRARLKLPALFNSVDDVDSSPKDRDTQKTQLPEPKLKSYRSILEDRRSYFNSNSLFDWNNRVKSSSRKKNLVSESFSKAGHLSKSYIGLDARPRLPPDQSIIHSERTHSDFAKLESNTTSLKFYRNNTFDKRFDPPILTYRRNLTSNRSFYN